MDGFWELVFVFVEQCFNKVALRSSNMEMILSSGSFLLSSTEEMKRRIPTEKRSKNVTLFNAIQDFLQQFEGTVVGTRRQVGGRAREEIERIFSPAQRASTIMNRICTCLLFLFCSEFLMLLLG